MFGFGNEKERSAIESLFDAYKIGEMPLALVVLGALCLLVPFGQAIANGEGNIVDPGTAFVVGGGIVLVGGITWAISLHQRTRFQIAVLNLIGEVSRQAATTQKDGANFKVAMEKFTEELPRLVAAMTAAPVRPANDGNKS